MTILVIDTSQTSAFIGLVQASKFIALETIPDAKLLSQLLFPALKKILDNKRPDAIAVDIGPGSFTGTRVGAMTAQTLAFAWEIPLLTFSAHLLPDLSAVAQEIHANFLQNQSSTQLDLVYFSPTA